MTIDEVMALARAAIDQILATKLEETRLDLLDAGIEADNVARLCRESRREMANFADEQLAEVRREIDMK